MNKQLCVVSFGIALFSTSMCLAQITTDGSVGPRQTLTGSNMQIGAELGSTRGSNLFHSFQQFDIPTGHSATFIGPDKIQNVISRVTGGKTSNIDGQLRSTVGKADVYLINPSGVVMGANASVDVPAALHLSTADEVRFSDGSRYSARDPASSSLIVAAPESFGFLSPQPATLTVNGSQLSVKAGKHMTLSSGDVTITGSVDKPAKMTAPGGTIRVEAVGKTGKSVAVNQPSATPGSGKVTVKNARIETSGDVDLNTADSAKSSKTININADSIDMTDSVVAADHWGNENSGGQIGFIAKQIQITNSDVRARVYGAGRGNDIIVDTEDLTIDAATAADGRSRLITRVMTGASGLAGDVRVNAARIMLTNGGQIGSIVEENASADRSGTIEIKATDSITIDGSNNAEYFSGIATVSLSSAAAGSIIIDSPNASLNMTKGAFLQSGTPGSGSAGDIKITIHDFNMSDAASIDSSTFGSGNAGTIQINATEAVMLNESHLWADTNGAGNAGMITISTPVIALHSAELASTTFDSGQAGEIHLIAPNSVTLTNQSEIQVFSGASETESRLGDAGRIWIETGLLSMLDSTLDAFSGNLASAGSIDVIADRIYSDNTVAEDGTFDGQAPFSVNNGSAAYQTIKENISVTEEGLSGTIFLNASKIILNHDSDILTHTTAGNAGSLVIKADNLSLLNGSDIFTVTTGPGRGGDVDIQVKGTFLIEGGKPLNASSKYKIPGGITTSPLVVAELPGHSLMTGPAGSITISAAELIIGQDGAIQSDSISNAPAGAISINVGTLEVRDGGQISSGAIKGGAGAEIQINASEQVHVHGVNPVVRIIGSSIQANASPVGGIGGSILIDVPIVLIEKGGEIISYAFDDIDEIGFGGAAGAIALNVNDLVLRSGGRIDSSTSGTGQAGQIHVNATSLLLDGKDGLVYFQNTGILSDTNLNATGNAGTIELNIKGNANIQSNAIISTETTSQGNAGHVNLNVDGLLEVLSGAQISTSTKATGNAGTMTVQAGAIRMDGSNSTRQTTYIVSNAYQGSTGNAGAVNMSVEGLLEMLNGAQISSDTWGAGNAGTVTVQTEMLQLNNRAGVFSGANPSATGQVGDVTIRSNAITLTDNAQISIAALQTVADPTLRLDRRIQINAASLALNASTITAQSTGNVPAAAIQINAADLRLNSASRITTESLAANAGAITIDGDILWLRDSQITTSAEGQNGNGGDIVLTPHNLILQSGFIQANTAASGARGGDIRVNSDTLIASQRLLAVGGNERQTFIAGDGRNIIQAAAPGGEQGNINILALNLDISASVVPPSAPFSDPDDLLADICRTVNGPLASSLIDRGNGGVPADPSAPVAVSLGGTRLDRILNQATE